MQKRLHYDIRLANSAEANLINEKHDLMTVHVLVTFTEHQPTIVAMRERLHHNLAARCSCLSNASTPSKELRSGIKLISESRRRKRLTPISTPITKRNKLKGARTATKYMRRFTLPGITCCSCSKCRANHMRSPFSSLTKQPTAKFSQHQAFLCTDHISWKCPRSSLQLYARMGSATTCGSLVEVRIP